MNSAARLHRIYDHLASITSERPMLNTWAEVFKLDQADPNLEHKISHLVMALHSEVGLVRSQLEAVGVTASLLDPGLTRLRSIATPSLLGSAWSSHRGNITPPECRKVFEWGEWALREDAEDDVQPAELQRLGSELDALEAALLATEMTPFLRQFIAQQIELIRSALRMYPVQGIRSVDEALVTIAGALTISEKSLKKAVDSATPEAKGVFDSFKGMVATTATVSDNISKIGKAVSETVGMAKTVGALLLPYAEKAAGAFT